jgi:hypothetical protein
MPSENRIKSANRRSGTAIRTGISASSACTMRSISPHPRLLKAEPVDDHQVSPFFDCGGKPPFGFGEPPGIEMASGGGGARIGYEADGFATRQDDNGEPRVLRLAATASLDDPDRTKPCPAQVVGEFDQQAVRIVASSMDDCCNIALGIELHAACLMERCIRHNISTCTRLQARNLRCIMPS